MAEPLKIQGEQSFWGRVGGLSSEGVGHVQGKDQVMTDRVSQSGLIMTDKFPQWNLCPGLSLLGKFVGPGASSSKLSYLMVK